MVDVGKCKHSTPCRTPGQVGIYGIVPGSAAGNAVGKLTNGTGRSDDAICKLTTGTCTGDDAICNVTNGTGKTDEAICNATNATRRRNGPVCNLTNATRRAAGAPCNLPKCARWMDFPWPWRLPLGRMRNPAAQREIRKEPAHLIRPQLPGSAAMRLNAPSQSAGIVRSSPSRRFPCGARAAGNAPPRAPGRAVWILDWAPAAPLAFQPFPVSAWRQEKRPTPCWTRLYSSLISPHPAMDRLQNSRDILNSPQSAFSLIQC